MERYSLPFNFPMSSSDGNDSVGPRRGSFAKGGGDFGIERLAVRGIGLGTDGGGSLSHSTGDVE